MLNNGKLLGKIGKLESTIDGLESEIESSDEIMPGDKAYVKRSLIFNDPGGKEIPFVALFEVDIIEVSDKKVKVTAYDATEDISKPFPPEFKKQNYKAALCAFFTNQWIDRSSVSPLIGVGTIRNNKINKLLS